MASNHFLEFQQSTGSSNVHGLWRLTAGQALSLKPRRAGVLRIARGAVWATLDVQHSGAGNQSGDRFLQAGDQLIVQAGQHLVLESMERAVDQNVSFDWSLGADCVGNLAANPALGVVQPLQDLGLALRQVGAALTHLATGMFVYGRQLVSSRPTAPVAHCG